MLFTILSSLLDKDITLSELEKLFKGARRSDVQQKRVPQFRSDDLKSTASFSLNPAARDDQRGQSEDLKEQLEWIYNVDFDDLVKAL